MKVIKLFWVDDMENWAKSAQTNLQLICGKYEIDLKIVPAVNGEDIVQKLMQFDFDGIIMDYNMEPFNGDKYINDIRYEDHLDEIPILFYSQDNNIDLNKLVANQKNIVCVYRGNLEDKVKEIFF